MVRLMWAVLLVMTAGCGAARAGAPASGDVITADELGTVRVSTAYEIIERLRPAFLRGRGQVSLDPTAQYPVVYVDGMRQGGPEILRRVAAQDVGEIRYIRARDATTRYGTGHTGGVIEVTTRR
jgi:outer membrane receptor for ferrienterochelin and colicin